MFDCCTPMRSSIACGGLALLLAGAANARIHELDVTLDARRAFAIEDFGFQAGGHLNLAVDGFKVCPMSRTFPQAAP